MMSLFDNFKSLFCCFKINRVSFASPSPAKLSSDVKFARMTYPRTSQEQIPLVVTATDCEYYLEEVIKLGYVHELGKGAFGVVFNFSLASAMKDTQPEPKDLAVKTFRFGSVMNDRCECFADVFRKEVLFYQRVKHPNIVRFHSYFNLHWNGHKNEYFLETDDLLQDHKRSHYLMGGIVLEKVQHTLTEHLNNNPMDERLIIEIFLQIGGALVYMHRKYFTVHRDLKGTNIGVAHISPDRIPHLVLLDFGSCGMDNVKQFIVAEQYSTRAFIESTPADIYDPSMKDLNANCFLDESRRLAQMIIRFSTNQKILADFLNAAFQKIPMKDRKLKRMLLRMSTKFVAQSVSLSQAWHYLGLE